MLLRALPDSDGITQDGIGFLLALINLHETFDHSIFLKQPQSVVGRKEMVLAGNVRNIFSGLLTALREGEAPGQEQKE